jgi:hypothetical protein
MAARKIDWSLSPAQRELLRRDCEASKVPIAVENPNAIKRVVGLITNRCGIRQARAAVLAPCRHTIASAPQLVEPPAQHRTASTSECTTQDVVSLTAHKGVLILDDFTEARGRRL